MNDNYDENLMQFIKRENNQEIFIRLIDQLLTEDHILKLRYHERIMLFLWINFIYNSISLSEKEKMGALWSTFTRVIYLLIDRELLSELMYFANLVYIAAIMAVENLTEDFKKIERDINVPCRELYRKWLEEHPLPEIKGSIDYSRKVKVAFVRPVLNLWSPFKLEYSLIKSLLRDENFTNTHEIFYYTMELPDFGKLPSGRQCEDLLRNLGLRVWKPDKSALNQWIFVDRLDFVLKFREQLIKDDIDILIHVNHLYTTGEFLFLSRAAPLQVYWCHMNHELDIEGIDKRIIHYQPPFDCTHREKFEIFRVTQDEIFLRGDEESYKKQAKEIRKRFPENTIILGSIGRLIKIDNYDYLSAVAEILKQNPDTIYLACGGGHTESIKKKLKELNVDENRFIFEGWVDPRVYRYVIDVYLNTFPFGSGEALPEFCAKGGEAFFVSL
jgi:glycosyltransferase involved in cell wall biosynthesis